MNDKKTTEEADEKLVKEIGARLRKIRKQLEYSQKDFAETVNVSNPSLCEMEAGNARPRFELIYNIIKIHKVNIQYLLFGKGRMFISSALDSLENEINIDLIADYRKFFKEFFYYFSKSELIRSVMMSFFREYILDNDARIHKDMLHTAGDSSYLKE
jgi:transcriptional regulator with XRE-family HTH domain